MKIIVNSQRFLYFPCNINYVELHRNEKNSHILRLWFHYSPLQNSKLAPWYGTVFFALTCIQIVLLVNLS